MKNKWFKGNIHCHTTNSDGDADPEFVVDWYKRHGYNFLVVSDHNHLTIIDYAEKSNDTDFIMIPGEEVTTFAANSIPVHINAIGIHTLVEPHDHDDVKETLQQNINAIISAGGLASINHPNYKWALTHQDISSVDGATMLEVFNGHPASNNLGSANKLSVEQIWDQVLSSGKLIFGVATDDSHKYYDFTPELSNPGRGWLNVKASKLTQDSIMNSLRKGDFYSSTGIQLKEINCGKEFLEIEIAENPKELNLSMEYETIFTGFLGKELEKTSGCDANYQFRGDEVYVRATVTGSNGFKAWTQPVYLN
ncbi:MAG: PHP domain-containing protein [SAR202 cluster bacterium]|nr:PHP domain-containing protein [SAR202 cluster bacterium]